VKKATTVDIIKLEEYFKDNDVVTIESLVKAEIIRKIQGTSRVKILGNGAIKKKLTIAKDIQISASAKKAIEVAGGKVE
jgi:ribosomal protein L15